MMMSFYGLLCEKILEKKVSPTSDESKENNMIKQYFPNTAHWKPSLCNYYKNILNLVLEKIC